MIHVSKIANELARRSFGMHVSTSDNVVIKPLLHNSSGVYPSLRDKRALHARCVLLQLITATLPPHLPVVGSVRAGGGNQSDPSAPAGMRRR